MFQPYWNLNWHMLCVYMDLQNNTGIKYCLKNWAPEWASKDEKKKPDNMKE